MRRPLISIFNMMNGATPVAQPNEWISIHNTALRTGSTTILLPFSASTGNRTIDWGDGVVEVVNTANPSHTYAANGIYTVTVSGGTTTRLGNILDLGWQRTVTEVVSWGKLGWTSFQDAFRTCTQNVKLPTYIPSAVLNCANMFYDAKVNQNIASWDVSNVTNMSNMFYGNTVFNQDISSWNTSKVTNFSFMFYFATAFNQDISSWNVSAATTLSNMFNAANAFNQNLGAWQLRRAGVIMTNILNNASAGLSTENYSRTLIGWANYVAQTGTPATVTLGASGRKYNSTVYAPGSTYTNAVDARAYLVTAAPNGPGWTITDGGLA